MERWDRYQQALEHARAQGRPLLIVGRPVMPWNHPCGEAGFGDVCLDLSPAVLSDCPQVGVVGDVRAIPAPNGYFGGAMVSHVLEHLPTVEDVELAWQELWRVADAVWVAFPRKCTLLAWLVPDHYHWVYQDPSDLTTLWVEPRWSRIERAQQGHLLGPYAPMVLGRRPAVAGRQDPWR